MSPTIMATLTANVPPHNPPRLFLSLAPLDVLRTQITGALPTADVTQRIQKLPLILFIQPHLLPVTIRAITSTTTMAIHTAYALLPTGPQTPRIFHATTHATIATTITADVTAPAACRLQLHPVTIRVVTNTTTTGVSIVPATQRTTRPNTLRIPHAITHATIATIITADHTATAQ